MSHTAHVFTSKNRFWQGFLFIFKSVFRYHTYTYTISTMTDERSTWKPKFVKKNESHQVSVACLDLFLSRELLYLFLLSTCNRVSYDFVGSTLHIEIKWMYKRFLFSLISVCCVWHARISIRKYMLTGVSGHDKCVWWLYMFSTMTEARSSQKQKVTAEIETSGIEQYQFQMHDL